ncbi:Arylsulfatase (plasmid) [Variovorax sp. SRS16]|uniref:sulfatase-like hydrolase/transferase n=1 Tax=Variovorax sp. SRS16 TaxID=282217 RepID=UPI001319167F|nr:sulfatase-like hydrolase/transferase [Variovorax sp. SRS16]VTU46339.1 Arylsulfatase [Variovorax sp. SRS16]
MRRPNFIFILADDLGYADLGCMGARDEHGDPVDVTPRLDRLGAEGMLFTRGYANSAVCSPTRFALITGRWQYRLRGGAEEPLPSAMGDKILGLPPSHPTLPSLLKAGGYATALIGKWHLGHPPSSGPRLSGYDEFFGFHSGGADYFGHTDPRGKPDLWRNEKPVSEDGYLTDLFSREAVSFIERQSQQQPFMLSLHYNAPHWPWLTREDREESRRIAGVGKHVDGGSLDVYRKMIHHMDEGIGWVMDALERQGMAQDTVVVFTSDNGGERYANNWPFIGQKMDLLEGGLRVPLIARWPRRIRPGTRSKTPVITMDWVATFLEAAGVPPHRDYPLDGLSLLPLMEDPSWNPDRRLYWRMKHRGQRAILRGDWKWLEIDQQQYLFNVERDPRERANLKEREPEIANALRAQWTEWERELPPIPADAKASLAFDERDLPRATF